MSTEKDTLSKESWENISMCCQTLCDPKVVIDYVIWLEQENEMLREKLKRIQTL
jgi:hypothetical protein